MDRTIDLLESGSARPVEATSTFSLPKFQWNQIRVAAAEPLATRDSVESFIRFMLNCDAARAEVLADMAMACVEVKKIRLGDVELELVDEA